MTALTMPRLARGAMCADGQLDRAPRSERTAGVRLTRRGRFFLVGLPFVTGAAALLVVAAVFLVPSTVKASTAPVAEPVTHSVTVQSN